MYYSDIVQLFTIIKMQPGASVQGNGPAGGVPCHCATVTEFGHVIMLGINLSPKSQIPGLGMKLLIKLM